MIILTIEQFTKVYGVSRVTQHKALAKKKIKLQSELMGGRWRLVYSKETEVEAVLSYMGARLMTEGSKQYLVKVLREIKKPAV